MAASIKNYVRENEPWLGPTLSVVAAIFITIYFTLLATKVTGSGGEPIRRQFEDLSWYNLLLVVGIILVGLQITAVIIRARSERVDEREIGCREAEKLLNDVVDLLTIMHGNGVVYRALITTADLKARTRKTACGANMKVYPDETGPFPLEFGVAGRAFANNSMQIQDITDANRDKTSDGQHAEVAGKPVEIWPQLRCVLAFPMRSRVGTPFGTVNFDANATSEQAGLADPRLQNTLASIAEFICYVMRAHSPDGRSALSLS
jgi:hypothetical protein